MSMPSPFEMGKAIGGNVSGGIREGVENSGIDQILQQAQATGDPAQIQNVMNQIITRVSPEKRPIVMQALQNRQQQIVDQQTQSEYSKMADYMEKANPDSALHGIMANVYRSNIPVKQKTELAKNLMSLDPYKVEQQQRLREDSVLKNFNSLIKEINEELKDPLIDADRKSLLEKRRERLQAERNELTKFKSLTKEAEEEALEVFDKTNPKHKAARKKALKEAKGDKKKANEILSRMYR